jgi:hypothetical protein
MQSALWLLFPFGSPPSMGTRGFGGLVAFFSLPFLGVSGVSFAAVI